MSHTYWNRFIIAGLVVFSGNVYSFEYAGTINSGAIVDNGFAVIVQPFLDDVSTGGDIVESGSAAYGLDEISRYQQFEEEALQRVDSVPQYSPVNPRAPPLPC